MSTNYTCNGKCSRCGQCCMPCVPLTLEEYYRIKEYINHNNIKPNFPTVIDDNLDLRCVFLDRNTNRCSIYPVRPQVCQRFLCSHSSHKEKKNREYFDARADINGDHLDRFVPMDLLFYDNPMTAIMMAHRIFHGDTPEKLIAKLYKLGGDKEFFETHHIPSCAEVAQAIEKQIIRLEWNNNG